MVNRKWASKIVDFVRVDARTAYLDVNIPVAKLRIVTTYFPHSGYADSHVQSIYTTLTAIQRECKDRRLIICGDFNAETGSRTNYDNERIIGKYGLNTENQKGQWMKLWATSINMVITNTFFSKRPCNRETFIGPNGCPRQLDYILMDKTLVHMLQDSGSSTSLNLGSDHKAVKVIAETTPTQIQ